jgi:type IV pilus assembly protein PilV
MHMIRTKPRRSAVGYALLEALVAVVVASVGFIGAARMQTVGMSLSNSAQSRQKATMLAYQMTDRIRANRAGVDSGAYFNPVAGDNTCLHNGAGCNSAAQMAAADLREWLNDITAQLPQGEGVVCRDSTNNSVADKAATAASPGCDDTGDVIAIKIFWTDNVSPTRFVTMVRP